MTEAAQALLQRADLNPTARLVAAALALRFGVGQAVHVGMTQLCQMTGLPDRTCRRALREAIEGGAVSILTPSGHGRQMLLVVMRPGDPVIHAAPQRAARPAAISAAKLAADPPPAAKLAADVTARGGHADEDRLKTGGIAPISGGADHPMPPPPSPPPSLPSALPSLPPPISPPSSAARAHRNVPRMCPEDFSPDAKVLAWVRDNCPRVDPSYELSKFVMYWRERRTMRSAWQASFRTWCEIAEEKGGSRRGHGSGGPASARPPSPRRSAGMEELEKMMRESRG
jgi:hypothetical protein